MIMFKRYITNYRPNFKLNNKQISNPYSNNTPKSVKRNQLFQSTNKQNSKIALDEADLKLKTIMEQRLFSALPDSWNSSKVTNLQKFISGTFISLLFGGGIIANYYDSKTGGSPKTSENGTQNGSDLNKEFSRTIISCEIHLLSSYLAFIVSSVVLTFVQSGVQSGLQHYLGCGIVQKRFHWIPHYRQAVGVSGVLAASFASANSDVASRTVLYFLLLSYFGILGNEYLFSKLKMAPQWMKLHSKRKALGIFLGILLLLMCESQTLPGKTPEL